MNIDRNKLIEEQRLREYIKRAIKVVKKKMIAEGVKSKEEETKLREYVAKLIEADSNVAAPHESTGINVLEDLLKKIIPQLEIEYKKLYRRILPHAEVEVLTWAVSLINKINGISFFM